MKSPYANSILSLSFVLAMSGVEASTWTAEVNIMKYPNLPQPPMASTDSQSHTQQHFSGNGGSIDMQIVGKTPTVNPLDNSQLDFAAGSSIRVTIQPYADAALTVILWNASGCISTQSGQSHQCQAQERRQIVALVKQLPATPVPPVPPGNVTQ